MELVASNIQVLLQAAEYLERRERGTCRRLSGMTCLDQGERDARPLRDAPVVGGRLEVVVVRRRRWVDAEHGYASLSPSRGRSPLQAHRRRRPRPRPRKALKDLRSVHNELEKHRRAQLRQCLDHLKQQVPISRDHAHYTTLSLLHQARLHIKKLEERDQRAQKLKERLRCEQQNLHQRLEELMARSTVERPRADSLDSSRFSSEHSETEDVEVDVEGLPFSSSSSSSSKEDATAAFSTGQEHSYSNISNFWI